MNLIHSPYFLIVKASIAMFFWLSRVGLTRPADRGYRERSISSTQNLFDETTRAYSAMGFLLFLSTSKRGDHLLLPRGWRF